MKNTQVVRLFNVLDKAEKRRLQRMLETSDKGKDVHDLCAYLIKYAHKPKRLDKKTIFKAIYSEDVPFNGKKLGQLRFQLYHVIEDFIVAQQLTRSKDNKASRMVQRELLLLEYLDEKILSDDQDSDDLTKLTTQKISDLKSLLEKGEKYDMFHYLNLHKLNYQLYYYANREKGEQGRSYIETLMKNLDTFYCLAKLCYANELLMREKILNEDASILLLDEMRDYSKVLAEESVYMSDIYQVSLELIESFDEEKFNRLKKQILTNAEKFEKNEFARLLGFLLNHIDFASKKSNIDLRAPSHEIYKIGVTKEIFLYKGFISAPILLLNYAYLCAELDQVDEIAGILAQYDNKIEEEFKDDTFRLCTAYQHFGKNNFYEAYLLVDDNAKRSLSFGLHQKSLRLKCLYELENSSRRHPPIEKTLYDACEYYHRYIKRNSGKLKEEATRYENFVELLLKLNNPNTEKETLENTVKDENIQIAYRHWLIQKIKEKR